MGAAADGCIWAGGVVKALLFFAVVFLCANAAAFTVIEVDRAVAVVDARLHPHHFSIEFGALTCHNLPPVPDTEQEFRQ